MVQEYDNPRDPGSPKLRMGAWHFKNYAFWRWLHTPLLISWQGDWIPRAMQKHLLFRKDWIEHMHLKSHVSTVSAKNDTWSVLPMVSNVHHNPSNKRNGKARRWPIIHQGRWTPYRKGMVIPSLIGNPCTMKTLILMGWRPSPITGKQWEFRTPVAFSWNA